MGRIIVAQGAVRRYFAKKELKKLKIEAKSVSKQRELNKGLENKIISLQQRLTETKAENKELRNQVEKGAELTEEIGKMKKAEEESKVRGGKIRDLEEELRLVKAELPIIQATQLLQARKSEDDVIGICDMCDKLRVSQIIKILNLYTPADEFEERVSPAFVRKIQGRLQERAMEEAKNQVTLLMDTKFSFAVRFPFNPSNINFAELEVPELYNNLPTLVRKV